MLDSQIRLYRNVSYVGNKEEIFEKTRLLAPFGPLYFQKTPGKKAKKKSELKKIREKFRNLFFRFFRNFFSVEIFHTMCRLRMQSFMALGQTVPEI